MLNIDAYKVAVNLLNTTLGLDDLPLEVHGRIATALILLDRQDDEDFYSALTDAYNYIGKDNASLEEWLDKMEGEND